MSLADISVIESPDVCQLYEATPVDDDLHETRLFTNERIWFHTKFMHRTSTDLLESISSQKMQCNTLLKIRPTSYPIIKCDKYPKNDVKQQYAYHRLIWGKEGNLKGYGYPTFEDVLQPGFYSIRKREYEIKLMEPGYAGNLLRAQITSNLVLLIQPQYLSSFLSNFIVQHHKPTDRSQQNKTDGFNRFFEPQCSSLFLSIHPENVCLASELNIKLHEFPWFTLKPEPPQGNRRFPKIFLDPAAYAIAS
jgi:hypothetical protein